MVGACHDETPIRVGMTKDEVNRVLGNPGPELGFGPDIMVADVIYSRTDWLGGRRQWVVIITRRDTGPQARVTGFHTAYYPFADMPPWLNAFRDAFGPRPAP